MKIEFNDSALICPNCGNDNLHQNKVKVFFRDEEYSKTGEFIECSKQDTIPICNEDNPSPKSDGLLIQFSCEMCSSDPELAIYQHKGNTYFKWHTIRMPIMGEF